MTPLMTVRDVCELARCERSKVDRATRLWRRHNGTKGGLPYQQTSPRSQLLFERSHVEKWLKGEPISQRLRAAS